MKEIKSNKKNPLIKIFIKICRLFGFEIIDQSNFSIPTSGKDLNESISVPGKRSITLPLGKIKITRPVKSLDIILRTCMSVNMLTQTKKRMFEKELSDLKAGKRKTINQYFVHSYADHSNNNNDKNSLFISDFGGYKFNSAIKKDNIVGLQFHPERSGETGIYLLSKIISRITDGI